MKNSFILEKHIDNKFEYILNNDKREINNPDKWHPIRLNYIDRLNVIISFIKKRYLTPNLTKIGDFGCAQGNLSLILAEKGYNILAIDINPIFIEYSKMKYEKGNIKWITSNIESLKLMKNSLDIALVGELIEHCAYPEEIIKKIFSFIRPGGLLLITTPNGSRFRQKLPTFKELTNKEKRKRFETIQFGANGPDHLFLFKLNEIKYILPHNSIILKIGYCGGIFFLLEILHPFIKLIPYQKIEKVIRFLSKIHLINKKLYNNIYIVVRKV